MLISEWYKKNFVYKCVSPPKKVIKILKPSTSEWKPDCLRLDSLRCWHAVDFYMTTVLLMGGREKHEEKLPWEDTDIQGKDGGDRDRGWSDTAERQEPGKAIDTW